MILFLIIFKLSTNILSYFLFSKGLELDFFMTKNENLKHLFKYDFILVACDLMKNKTCIWVLFKINNNKQLTLCFRKEDMPSVRPAA